MGYFEQELKWDNSDISPLELVSNLYPNLSTKNIRNMLATYGIVGEQAKQSIETLSGGEQSKLKLFILLHQYNNFIILDEPTNHLDLKAKEALKKVIVQFNGSVLIVSHEKDFYSSWVDKIINVEAFAKQ